MKKLILALTLISIISIEMRAQVKFSIELMSDRQTYMVSLISEETFEPPMNRASNIQVVLKYPTDQPFDIGELTSQIAGLTWLDDSYFDEPTSAEPYNLCAFTIAESSTNAILFKKGEEVPLFTFKNMEIACAGKLMLPENDDPMVRAAVANSLNYTQSITILGARGKAFSGLKNELADCSATSGIDEEPIVYELAAYPIPAVDELNIEWDNPNLNKELKLTVTDLLGQTIKMEVLDPLPGFKTHRLNVSDLEAGIYSFSLYSEEGRSQSFKFIKVK